MDSSKLLVARVRAAPALSLLLDYDGTLVPLAKSPELAAPDGELIDLLRALATRPRTEVHVVSGRPRETLERWLGALPIGLHAEHGLESRFSGAAAWMTRDLSPPDWRPAVLALMRVAAARTPGAFVEEKHAAVAWHHRAADPEVGVARARALELELAAHLRNAPVTILAGARVIEVLPNSVNKGRLIPPLIGRLPAGALLVAIGDDRTDEDLFAALPPGSLAIHVGPEPTRASIRLSGVPDARALLRAIVETATG